MRYRGDSLTQSEDGIFLREGDAEFLGRSDLYRLLHAVWASMPEGCVLVLADGSPSREFRAFLNCNAASTPLKVAGMRKPVFHIEIRPELGTEFLAQCSRLAEPEICMTALVYDREGRVLLCAFDTGDDLYVRRGLPAATIEALSATVHQVSGSGPAT
jgi:hypothetical protein